MFEYPSFLLASRNVTHTSDSAALLGASQFIRVMGEAVHGGEDFHERHEAALREELLQGLRVALFLLGRREGEAAVLGCWGPMERKNRKGNARFCILRARMA